MRVLAASDGSPSSAIALRAIAGGTWPRGTDVRLLRVIEPIPLLVGPWPATALLASEPIDASWDDDARRDLEKARGWLERPGVAVSCAVGHGRPATVILESAGAWPADLIVVGSRGRGPIGQMLLGSVSSEVVDHATVPVLVARGERTARVVLATDGSECARRAVEVVRSWQLFQDAVIMVTTIVDDRIPWWTGFPEPGVPEALPIHFDAVDAALREARAHGCAVVAELVAAGREAEAHVHHGDPAATIIREAAARAADLIVVGTHGRSALARVALGSVGRNVLHHSDHSVLVVR